MSLFFGSAVVSVSAIARLDTAPHANALIPVVPGYMELPDREGFVDLDPMARIFAAIVITLAVRRAHQEVAGQNGDHLRAVLSAFLELASLSERPLLFGLEHVRGEIRSDIR